MDQEIKEAAERLIKAEWLYNFGRPQPFDAYAKTIYLAAQEHLREVATGEKDLFKAGRLLGMRKDPGKPLKKRKVNK